MVDTYARERERVAAVTSSLKPGATYKAVMTAEAAKKPNRYFVGVDLE